MPEGRGAGQAHSPLHPFCRLPRWPQTSFLLLPLQQALVSSRHRLGWRSTNQQCLLRGKISDVNHRNYLPVLSLTPVKNASPPWDPKHCLILGRGEPGSLNWKKLSGEEKKRRKDPTHGFTKPIMRKTQMGDVTFQDFLHWEVLLPASCLVERLTEDLNLQLYSYSAFKNPNERNKDKA